MPTQAAELEAPPQEQQPQEGHADESADKATKRPRATAQSDLRRQQAFVVAYTTPTAPEFLQARKAAITAGYKEKYAASVASRLMKKPRIKELIEAAMAEITAKLTSEEVTIEFVKRKHLEAMARCQLAGDRTNEREHLECVGRMIGAYDVSLHLDLTVKHEYDERLALAAHQLARVALEEMGDCALGLPGPAVEVKVEVEGDRPAEGTLEPSADAPAGDEGDRTPSAPAVEGAQPASGDAGGGLGISQRTDVARVAADLVRRPKVR
ncbi:hypothetical protein ES708_26184 [subsurface metagenome]